MTLFKKVFGSHAASGMEEPVPLTLKDDAEFTNIPDEDFMARLASISDGAEFDLPEDEEVEDSFLDEDETPEIEMPMQGLMEAALPAEAPDETPKDSEPEPTMAERAAAAQRQIEMSQKRYVVEQGQSRDKPVPTEDAELKMPDPAAAVPDKSSPEPAEQAPAGPAASPPPSPATQWPGRSSRRTRTRLLGFDQGNDAGNDPFAKAAAEGAPPAQIFPVGWFVVVAGPGKGHSFAIFNGASTIGRGEDQAIKLDFGDTSISRQNHAAVAYDDEQNKFYLGHGGKSNIIRLNNRPVLSTEELSHADVVRIGETTLRFVALCGADFNWGTGGHDDA